MQTVVTTKVIGRTGRRMARGSIDGKMELSTLVNGEIMNGQGKECAHGQMGRVTVEAG